MSIETKCGQPFTLLAMQAERVHFGFRAKDHSGQEEDEDAGKWGTCLGQALSTGRSWECRTERAGGAGNVKLWTAGGSFPERRYLLLAYSETGLISQKGGRGVCAFISVLKGVGLLTAEFHHHSESV